MRLEDTAAPSYPYLLKQETIKLNVDINLRSKRSPSTTCVIFRTLIEVILDLGLRFEVLVSPKLNEVVFIQ